MIIPNIWENKKMFQTTNQYIVQGLEMIETSQLQILCYTHSGNFRPTPSIQTLLPGAMNLSGSLWFLHHFMRRQVTTKEVSHIFFNGHVGGSKPAAVASV